ncbi:hypothetical protein J2X65_003521 [Ancylobacter sp. 3268]|uniref:hypothetical protein n=1 Tax=Ancylobacter sp. 3268 TaxID=2817752 RepID=UPI00285EA7A0|nr:hypothetical protein [Ancylobacter sp. 3268]MDR6954153.1 hypothetical protein [Ancylobacter sp. 3268]
MPPTSRPAPPSHTITYLLIPVIGDIKTFELARPRDEEDYGRMLQGIRQHFDERFEHVAVLYNGERRDMFVGETSAINGRHIRNVRATAIYRANARAQWLAGLHSLDRVPVVGFNAEALPAISGPAVLFPATLVWR